MRPLRASFRSVTLPSRIYEIYRFQESFQCTTYSNEQYSQLPFINMGNNELVLV